MALAAKAIKPGVRVIGISMECGAAMHASLAAGRPVTVTEHLSLANAFVCDRVSQSEVSGDLEATLTAGIWTKVRPAELGEVIIGARPEQRSPQDITICDLTGTGVQDTAIATHVRARRPQAGSIIRA